MENKRKMEKLYKELNKFEENGKLKAVNLYGMEIGLGILDYLYTEITVKNTSKRIQALNSVTSWNREKFEQIVDLVKGMMTNEKH